MQQPTVLGCSYCYKPILLSKLVNMYIYLKLHSQVYTVAYYMACYLELIDRLRLSSTLRALPTDRLNSADLHQSQEHPLAKLGWTCPPLGDVPISAPNGISIGSANFTNVTSRHRQTICSNSHVFMQCM